MPTHKWRRWGLFVLLVIVVVLITYWFIKRLFHRHLDVRGHWFCDMER